MIRLVFLCLFQLLCGLLFAQEPETGPLPKEDSIRFKFPVVSEPGPMMNDFETTVSFDAPAELVVPDFDLTGYFHSKWTINYASVNYPSQDYPGYSLLAPGIILPFGGSGRMFSEATYKVNNKLIIGGYSFGANPLFTAPLSLPGIDNWNIRGASMFMEYKVSKNFRIGAGVTVSENPYHP